MPAKSYYDLATDENYDIKIPAYPEEAFQQGIRFCAKYIGTQDISRPSSRVEIVAAMRHIRYEYKAKGVKKRNVVLCISVTGIDVYYQKRRRKMPIIDGNCVLLMKHPTYRVFYVSHDSQDLKILSYIARDSGSNVFRCSVFKAYKKSDAILIVRTIGQAFEVCHKLNQQQAKDAESQRDDQSEKSTSQSETRASSRLPNSESVLSGASSAISHRSADNGSSMHKSDSTHSAPHQTGVSASSTATSGFMQNSIYSSESLPNAFAALLNQSIGNLAVTGRVDKNGDQPVNVETAIKTAQELLRYATNAYRRPNNVNTPGSISATTSFHESVSMPRSPSTLQVQSDTLLSEVQNVSLPNNPAANLLPATLSHNNLLASNAVQNSNHLQMINDRLQSADRFPGENLASTSAAPNVVNAIAEAKQRLLQEQLIHETALRIEAQARVQQLLVINKQLTQHIYRLSERVQRLQADLTKLPGTNNDTQIGAAEHIQTTGVNGLVQPAAFGTSNVALSSDIPRLEPPPSLHRHHLRMGTCKNLARETFTTLVNERSGARMANADGNQQVQVGFNNLDLLASQNAQAHVNNKVINGLKNDHLLLFSSSSGSDDENNKTKLIRAQTAEAD